MKIMPKRIFTLLFFILSYASSIYCQNLHQVTSTDGLTTNRVLSLAQSDDGYLWLGTSAGINTYCGNQVVPSFKTIDDFNGYTIEELSQTSDTLLWVRTHYFIRRLNTANAKYHDYQQFSGWNMMRDFGKERVVVWTRQKRFHLYDPATQKFKVMPFKADKNFEVTNMGLSGNTFWFSTNRGLYVANWNARKNRLTGFRRITSMETISGDMSDDTNRIILVEKDGVMSEVNLRTGHKERVADVNQEMRKYGKTVTMVKMHGAYFVAYYNSNVVKYSFAKDGTLNKRLIKVNTRIKKMVRDKQQDIIWIATDGEGLYSYWEDNYEINCYEYKNFDMSLGSRVNAFAFTADNNLYLATNGNGLLCFQCDNDLRPLKLQKQFLTINSQLPHDKVSGIASSRHGGLWVGTEGGLSFFDFRSKTFTKMVPGLLWAEKISEINDSTLWVATLGCGVYKLHITNTGGIPRLSIIDRLFAGNHDFPENLFYTMSCGKDGSIWLGGMGVGIYRVSNNDKDLVHYNITGFKSQQNDVLSLLYDHGNLYVSSGIGLMRVGKDGSTKMFSTANGLPNNVVHGMIFDNRSILWVSTSNGIAAIKGNNVIRIFDRNYGLTVNEFSDDAVIRHGNDLFFGGMNGWLQIKYNPEIEPHSNFTPNIRFLSMSGKMGNVNIYQEMLSHKIEDKDYTLELPYDENSFTLSFAVMDNIASDSYELFYRIRTSGSDHSWNSIQGQNSLSLVDLSPGTYTIEIKCRNRITGVESAVHSLRIDIAHPWYSSMPARFVYLLLVLALVYFIINYLHRRETEKHMRMMKQLEYQHRENLYEEKLRFFTNITHELGTPLTLIYSSSEQLLSNVNLDSIVRKYLTIIKSNAMMLYGLIQDIIEYRKIETSHEDINISQEDLSALCSVTCASFHGIASTNGIDLKLEIKPGITWFTDKKYFVMIVNNLVSNAMKYTPKCGRVRIILDTDADDSVKLSVYNTGKGMSEEEKENIFSRYSVFNNVEDNARKGLYSHNGLGLSICHSLVTMLGGRITINSTVNEYTEFVVTLPKISIAEVHNVITQSHNGTTEGQDAITNGKNDNSVTSNVKDNSAYNILVVDDNEDMLYILKGALAGYTVRTASSAAQAQKEIKKSSPDLVITDVMMDGMDGIEFTRKLKSDKFTVGIPIIMLSAKTSEEAQVEGLQTGADVYMKKPFSIKTLRAQVARLLDTRGELKDYYTHSASSISYVDGKQMHAEDKDFVASVNAFIDKNIGETDLTVDYLSAGLGMSTRSLYRKFKELDLPSPNDYVKIHRIAYAARQLVVTSKTVKEIMFDCGFVNRAHFNREFLKCYGMTPSEYREKMR